MVSIFSPYPRCVAIYEIGCVIPFSTGWFEEGPRLGVFRKSNLLSKKAKKKKTTKKAKSRSLLKPPGGKWNHATYFINCNTSGWFIEYNLSLSSDAVWGRGCIIPMELLDKLAVMLSTAFNWGKKYTMHQWVGIKTTHWALMSVCQAALLVVVSVVVVWYGMPAECGTNIYICTYILLIWHVIGLDIKCEKIIHIKSHISSSNDYDCMICVCVTVLYVFIMDTITFTQRHCCMY